MIGNPEEPRRVGALLHSVSAVSVEDVEVEEGKQAILMMVADLDDVRMLGPSLGGLVSIELARDEAAAYAVPESPEAAIRMAQSMVSMLCHRSRRWVMSIPAQPNQDPDLVIGRGLRVGMKCASRLNEAEGEIKAQAQMINSQAMEIAELKESLRWEKLSPGEKHAESSDIARKRTWKGKDQC